MPELLETGYEYTGVEIKSNVIVADELLCISK